MSPEEINNLLHRPIKKGIEYDHLMPFSDCSSTLLANGDTKEAINQMAFWTKKYQHHTKLLADTIFKKYSLIDLCKYLHEFLYYQFQYRLDGYEQKLRSPACSWASKKEGIDCKSYSIFCGGTLLNLGVSFYYRRVIQNQGEGYSHVYVIIPKNQETNDLKDGYYVIDGTILHSITEEVNFYKKDDLFVTQDNAVLAGASMQALDNAGAKVISVVTELLIQGFLNEVMGCDDAAYELPIVQLKLQRNLQTPLIKKLKNLAHSISINNKVRIEHLFNDIFKELDLGIAHLRNETAYSQRDECIANTLSTALKYAEEIKKVVDIYYENFKKHYPEFKISEYTASANVNQRTLYFVVENDSNTIKGDYRLIKIERDKSAYSVEPVFAFEENATEWLLNNINHLKRTYKDGRETNYKKEIEPILDEVIELRAKYYIGGEMLYYFEQPLQTKMSEVWLKYDDQYSQFLKKRAQANLQANEQAMAAYKERFKKEVEENEKAKKRKQNKMKLGIGLTIAAFLIAINIEKE